MRKYNTTTLDNGLRIIHMADNSNVVYCGYQLAVGTRHERRGEEGLAHFCEHLTFKGTDRFNALQIANHLEKVGGDINAFTTKDATVYHCAVMNNHLVRAINLLTDMVFHSTYPEEELEKEKEVVFDEIESYNDSPAELIYDEFENLLFKGHPLGHNILGTVRQVRQLNRDDVLRFTNHHYTTGNAIFFCYGNVDFQRLVSQLNRATLNCKMTPSGQQLPMRCRKPRLRPCFDRRQMNTHQAHVMTGTLAYSVHQHQRMALYLLNNIIGGPAMNATLNQVLRERYGLVYTVESTMVAYGDTGLWSIYFGCDPKDVEKCLALIRRELDRLMRTPLSKRCLHDAKQQLKGQISIACDNREQFALDFGKSFLHYGWEKDIDELFANIDQLTATQLQEVAQELFTPDRMTTLILN